MRGRRAHRGFSMIEMIVVVVILATLALAIAPRMTSAGSRRAAVAVEQVAQLLSAAAVREQLTSQRLVISYDESRRRLALLTPTADRGGASGASERAGWREDPLVPAITLNDVRVVQVVSDGVDVDPARWRVEFRRSEPRPAMKLVLEAESGVRRWAVVLTSGGSSAVILDPEQADSMRDSVDLDRGGGGGTPWS